MSANIMADSSRFGLPRPIRSRLGVASLVLQQAPEDQRAPVSRLQTHAIVSVISESRKEWTPEQRSEFLGQVADLGLVAEDLASLVKIVAAAMDLGDWLSSAKRLIKRSLDEDDVDDEGPPSANTEN